MENNSLNNKFELHYYFDDDKSHSMDAFTRNKCEHEILQIVSTLSKELKIHVKIETEAYREGGLTEWIMFLALPEAQPTIQILMDLLIAFLAIIPKKSKLELTDQKLSIEEKELRIKLLKDELKRRNIASIPIDDDRLDFIINKDIKMIKHKSNFYKNLTQYPKVNKISTAILDIENKPIETPRYIESKDFKKYILQSDELEPIEDNSALIEIISPVLKKGKYKWKGLYKKNITTIEFTMKDRYFKSLINQERVVFKSGASIKCILTMKRKIDDIGNIYVSDYSVSQVLKHKESDSADSLLIKKGESPYQQELFGDDY